MLADKLIKNISKCIKKVLLENEALLAVETDDVNNIENKNNMQIPIYLNKYSANYIFDDIDQISEDERYQQYIIPLKSYAKSAGYGHKIMFLDEGKTVKPYHAAGKTEDPEYTIQEMQKIFKLEKWQTKYYIQCNNIHVVTLIANLYDNKDIVIEMMKAYGWSFSFSDIINISGQKWVMLQFDPVFQDTVNDVVKNNPVLLHWTPKYHYDDIKNNGLMPKSDNYLFSYPPKIHLIKGDTDINNIMDIGYKLNITNKDIKNDGHYVLLNVDTIKISDNIDFFL